MRLGLGWAFLANRSGRGEVFEAGRSVLGRGPPIVSLSFLLLGREALLHLDCVAIWRLLRENYFLADVLHRLHELLLMKLILFLLGARVAVLHRHHRLAHRDLLFVELRVLRIVEVFRARLGHGPALVVELQGSLRGESNFVLLLHVTDLRLLLLHYFW